MQPNPARQTLCAAKHVIGLQEDVAYAGLQRAHGHALALHGVNAELLVVVLIHCKYKAQWLALAGAGVADDGRKEHRARHAINQWLLQSAFAQLVVTLGVNAGQAAIQHRQHAGDAAAGEILQLLLRGGGVGLNLS